MIFITIFTIFSIFSSIGIGTIDAKALRDYYPRKVYAYQREITRPASADSHLGGGTSHDSQIICLNGKIMHRRCVCNFDYFGEHCERKIFCKGYERERNGSCVECADKFTGENCDHPICQNGGTENKYEQRCDCAEPHSGDHCDFLKVEDVYRFYNTKAAMIGPLGILTVIPMLICFYMCEKKARIRQVNRIQKSWSEQRKASIRSAHIAHLLAEKV